MKKQKLMTTKESIKIGIIFVICYTLGSYEESYEKEETNTVTTVVVDTTITELDVCDSNPWNGFRGIGDQEYTID
jgi:hypothetical protein